MKLKFVVCLILFLPAIFGLGQTAGNAIINENISRFPFLISNFGTVHGLPQNQVVRIIEKDDETVFVSTANGVVLFNGYNFENLPANSEIKKYIYYNLFWDEKSQKLYGNSTFGEYHLIYPTFEKLSGGFYHADFQNDTLFSIDSVGNLSASDVTRKKVYYTAPTKLRHVRLVKRIGNNFVLSNALGLFTYNKKTAKLEKIAPDSFENGIHLKKYKKYAFTSANYILFLDKNLNRSGVINLSNFMENSKYPTQLRDVIQTGDSSYLISTSDEIIYYHNGKVNLLSEVVNFSGGSYFSILQHSKRNTIFVGSSTRGLVVFNEVSGKIIRRPNTRDEQSIGAVVVSDEQEVYTYSSKGKLLKLSNNQLNTIHSSTYAFSTLSFIDGYLYAGYWGEAGVEKFDVQGNRIEQSRAVYTNHDFGVMVIHKDKNNMFWVCTYAGVYYGESIRNLKKIENVSGVFYCVYEDQSGHVYLGGQNGFYKLLNTKNNPRVISKEESIGYQVRVLYEDDDGRLWIGTYGAGLFCYDKNKLFSFYKEKNVALSKDVFTLALDEYDRFLCSSNNGLFIVKKQALIDYMNGDVDYVIPIVLNSNSGIPSSEFNGGFQNNYAARKGVFYFPTIDGLYSVVPPKFNPSNRRVNISKFLVNDSIVSTDETIFLLNHENNIEIIYSSPVFEPSMNVHYQYRLIYNGTLTEWSAPSRDLSAKFMLLPSGNYTFQVRALDGNNDKSPKVSEITFTIEKSFFQTWFFYLLIIFFVAGLISIYLYLRTKAIQEKEHQSSNLNNYFLDLKMKAVQSKMNPHFLFNTLNNINYLLAIEQYEEAEDHLQEFSILVREFLQNSEKSFIKIVDEIKMIKLYLSLEKRRFPELLNYEVEVDEAIYDEVIPTLMIQPFVENAIKHGIAHSSVPCLLKVAIIKDSEGIEITISDNGIGRKRSMEINKTRAGHNSMGIDIVKDKIKVVRNKYEIFIDLKTIDLDEPNTGTIVKIKIPKHDKVFDS